MIRNFIQMLRAKWAEGKFLCVGLDSEYDKIPKQFKDNFPDYIQQVIEFNKWIIGQTREIVCAYKPNSAFYEAHGEVGMNILSGTREYILNVAPDVPVILDAKRADIGNTNKGYAKAAFEELDYDAITVHPYLGSEAMKPFLDYKDNGVIVLCRTSNKGAGEFQDLQIMVTQTHAKPLYEIVAETVRDKWNYNGNCLLVAGATYPEELGQIRSIVGNMPLLIPGVGTQGGDVYKVIENGLDDNGEGIIINSSSGIIFAENPGEAALKLHNEIAEARNKILELRKQSVH